MTWRPLAALAALTCACGGSPAPAAAPTTAPAPSPTASTATAEATTAPADEPDGLIATLEVNDARALGPLSRRLGGWLEPLRHTGHMDPVYAEKVATHAVLIVEGGALTLRPALGYAISVGVTSFDTGLTRMREAARAQERDVLRIDAGRYVWRQTSDGETCELLRSRGPTEARLVCGTARAVSRAAPYLATTMAARPKGSHVLRAQLLIERARKRHASLLRVGRSFLPSVVNSSLDDPLQRWLAPAVPTLTEEAFDVLEDAQRAELTVVERGLGVEVTARLALTRQTANSVRLLTELPQGPVPDGFLQLPPDSDLTWFQPALPEPRARELETFFSSWFQRAIGRGVSSDVIRLIARTFSPDAAMVYAHGDAYGRDASGVGGERLRQAMLSIYGWHIFGYKAPAKEYEPRLVEGMNAYNQGELRDLVYRELPRLCEGLGKIVRQPPPSSLPKGSALFEMKFPGSLFDDCWSRHRQSQGRGAGAAELVVIMVPAGDWTYIGMSTDRAGLIAKLAAIEAGRSKIDPRQLGLPGSGQYLAGGVVTLRGLAGMKRFVNQYEPYGARRRDMDRRPNKGAAPIPFSIAVESGQGSVDLVARSRLSREALEDMNGMPSGLDLAFAPRD